MKKATSQKTDSKVISIPNGKDKWKALAAMPNSRVIICNTPEAYAMADLARSADIGLNLLRKRLMVTIDPDVALPLMAEFNKKVVELEETIASICKKVNARHRMPKNIVNVRKQMGLTVEEEADEVEAKDSTETTDAKADTGSDKKTGKQGKAVKAA